MLSLNWLSSGLQFAILGRLSETVAVVVAVLEKKGLIFSLLFRG